MAVKYACPVCGGPVSVQRYAKRAQCAYCTTSLVVDRGDGTEPVSPGEQILRVSREGLSIFLQSFLLLTLVIGMVLVGLTVNYLIAILSR